MSLSDNVAIVALIVSLIALVIAVSQLLQQLFGTAEGYRRCRGDVIGPWAEFRHRHIVWRELRMETTFATPEFVLQGKFPEAEYKLPRPPKILSLGEVSVPGNGSIISGSKISCRETRTPRHYYTKSADEENNIGLRERRLRGTGTTTGHSIQAGWVTFLQQLHELEDNVNEVSPSNVAFSRYDQDLRICPAILFKKWSWDFMPPDVVRPMATAQLGDILVLTHRMRMNWRDLHPDERRMSADGNGHSLTAIELKGLGLVLQYQYHDLTPLERNSPRYKGRLFVPSQPADKLAFGIIPTDEKLYNDEDFPLGGGRDAGDIDLWDQMMERLGVKQETRATLDRKARDLFAGKGSGMRYTWWGPTDTLFVLAPFIPLPGVKVVRIVYPWSKAGWSIFNGNGGRYVIRERLESYITDRNDASTDLAGLFEDYKDLLSALHPPDSYGKYTIMQRQGLILDNLEKLRVSSHIEMATEAVEVAKAKEGKRRCDLLPGGGKDWVVETAHQYADRLKVIEDAVLEKNSSDLSSDLDHERFRRVVRDAWWIMIVRGFIWEMSTVQIKGAGYPLPSRYYGSSTSVWIT